MKKNKEYTLKEVSSMTGLSNDLIRLYEKEFNLQFKRTEGGHRRFNEKNVEMLNGIKQKIQNQNWSYKQVLSWMNGDVEPILAHDENLKTNLEKQLQELKEQLREKTERDEEFQKILVQKLDEQSKFYQQQLEEQRQFFEQKVLESQNDVTKRLAAVAEDREQRKKEERGFFGRLFKK